MKQHLGKPPADYASRFKSRLLARTSGAVVRSRLTLLALACALASGVHAATTILVTSTLDDGSAGTLRAALAVASDGDTIDATGITGTITLLPDVPNSSEFVIATSVTILGPGPDQLTIDGNHTSRVIRITPGNTVTLDGLAMVNGLAAGSLFPADAGGGIHNDHSVLNVINCIISGNSVSGFGGGILNDATLSGSATLTVANSIIRGNSAGEAGGIANAASGTGIATLDVENSTISGNSAGNIGGIYNFASSPGATATTAIIASTVSGNTAHLNVGAIRNSGARPDGVSP